MCGAREHELPCPTLGCWRCLLGGAVVTSPSIPWRKAWQDGGHWGLSPLHICPTQAVLGHDERLAAWPKAGDKTKPTAGGEGEAEPSEVTCLGTRRRSVAEEGAAGRCPAIQICTILKWANWLLNPFHRHFHYRMWLVTAPQAFPLLQTTPFLHSCGSSPTIACASFMCM